jgi:ribosomal protein L5
MKPTLQSRYEETLAKALQEELGFKNVNEVPRLEKISVNSHVGHYANERKAAVEDACPGSLQDYRTEAIRRISLARV